MEITRKSLHFIAWLGIALLQFVMGVVVEFLVSLTISVENLENIQQTLPVLLYGVMGATFSVGVFLMGLLALKLRWLKLKPKYLIRLATTLVGAYIPMILAPIIYRTGISFVLISLVTSVLGFYIPGWIYSEEEIVSSAPLNNQTEGNTPALWNPHAAGAWSFLFTPLFGSTLLLMNWQAIGNKEKLRVSQLWLVINIVAFVSGFFLPEDLVSKLYIFYVASWYFAEANPQAKYIHGRYGELYPRKKWWWPIIISFSAFISLIVLSFLIGVIQIMLSQ